jgi:4-carboxymuconolactone decarboxylase
MKPRIRLSDASHWSEATREVLRNATPAAESSDGSGPPNILYTIAHHPNLLSPFLGFASALALRGVLLRPDAELLALRTAWNCRSDFEWGHHAEYALAHGLSPEEIRRIADGPEHPGWGSKERVLLLAADELHANQHLTDEIFATLREAWSNAEIVEIVFVVGNYTMLSMVANATGVPVEQRLPAMPAVTTPVESTPDETS